jgi:hypothetical protein
LFQTAGVSDAQVSAKSERARATAEKAEFAETERKAKAGDAAAQFRLGEMYDKGVGVERSSVEAFRWWLAAAKQGVRAAQRNVGIAYLVPIGVQKSVTNAVVWLSKAAESGDKEAAAYVERLKKGQSASQVVAVVAPKQEETAGLSSAQGSGNGAGPGTLAGPAFEGAAPGSDAEKVLVEMLAEYHKTHTYVGGIYQCVEMANDVWNMALTKNINAKVLVGNVERDIDSLLDANHAWVLAEVSKDKWLALEATGGKIIFPQENKRYYHGHSFSNPKEIREFQTLKDQYNTAVSKLNAAADDYNQLAVRYNQANVFGRQQLEGERIQVETVLNQRKKDLEEYAGKLKGLLKIQ